MTNPRRKHIWKFAVVGVVLGIIWAALTYNSPARRLAIGSDSAYFVRRMVHAGLVLWLVGWLWARIWTPPDPPTGDGS